MDATTARAQLHSLGPGIIAATLFGVCDVLIKVVFASGADVLTLGLFRGLVGLAFMFVYMRMGSPPVPETPRARWIALGLGALFAGIVYCLFSAIERVAVPVAILTYFTYPLLTGIAGALFGIDKLSWRGAVAAVVAFIGLALMIGAHPEQVAVSGIVFGLMASAFRVAVLLIARVELQAADPRLTTWHSLTASTAIFALAAVLTMNWQSPQTGIGWVALITLSIGMAISILGIFVSLNRVGSFRTALIMNLEPLLATILSAFLLGEIITLLQAVGGAIMLAALVAFQLRR